MTHIWIADAVSLQFLLLIAGSTPTHVLDANTQTHILSLLLLTKATVPLDSSGVPTTSPSHIHIGAKLTMETQGDG